MKKELVRRIFSVCFVSFAAFMLAGCLGGGGGGGSSSSGVGGAVTTSSLDIGGSGAGSGSEGSGPGPGGVVAVHHPEPASILLLSSGLLGMAFRYRKRLKK